MVVVVVLVAAAVLGTVREPNTCTQYSNSLKVSQRRCHSLPSFVDLLPPPPLLLPFLEATSDSLSLTSLWGASSSETSPHGDKMISKVVDVEECFIMYVLKSKGRRFSGFPGA